MLSNGDLSDWSSYRSYWRSIWYLYMYIHMYILWSFIIDQSFKFEKGPSWGVLLMVVIARFDVLSDEYQGWWSFHNIKWFFVVIVVYNRYIESTSHPDMIFRRCIRVGWMVRMSLKPKKRMIHSGSQQRMSWLVSPYFLFSWLVSSYFLFS